MANTLTKATGIATTAGATIYTVPTGASITIIGLRCSNIDNGVNHTFSVQVSGHYVTGKLCPLPAGSALDIMVGSKIVAVAGDTIVVTADANAVVDVYISFLKQA